MVPAIAYCHVTQQSSFPCDSIAVKIIRKFHWTKALLLLLPYRLLPFWTHLHSLTKSLTHQHRCNQEILDSCSIPVPSARAPWFRALHVNCSFMGTNNWIICPLFVCSRRMLFLASQTLNNRQLYYSLPQVLQIDIWHELSCDTVKWICLQPNCIGVHYKASQDKSALIALYCPTTKRVLSVTTDCPLAQRSKWFWLQPHCIQIR